MENEDMINYYTECRSIRRFQNFMIISIMKLLSYDWNKPDQGLGINFQLNFDGSYIKSRWCSVESRKKLRTRLPSYGLEPSIRIAVFFHADIFSRELRCRRNIGTHEGREVLTFSTRYTRRETCLFQKYVGEM